MDPKEKKDGKESSSKGSSKEKTLLEDTSGQKPVAKKTSGTGLLSTGAQYIRRLHGDSYQFKLKLFFLD